MRSQLVTIILALGSLCLLGQNCAGPAPTPSGTQWTVQPPLVNVCGGFGGACVAPTPPVTSCGLLGSSCTSAAGAMPVSVAAADFNGDHQPDLAVANFGTNTIAILLNNGGTFTPAGEIRVGSDPGALAVADFDGDGRADIAVTGTFPIVGAAVSVLHGQGDGTFAAPVYLPAAGGAPTFVTAADLDGDGHPDVITANRFANSISLARNAGTGFSALTDITVGREPAFVAAADLDNDGDIDLAVVNHADNSVSILRNTGNGTFLGPFSFSVGAAPTAVAAADLDADGDNDLAVTNEGAFEDSAPDTVSILLNNGNATFATARGLPVGVNPRFVLAADVNGDGHLDLLVADYGTTADSSGVAVLLNNGNGTFGELKLYPAGGGPQALAIADFDRDGAPDLAVANFVSSTTSLLANNGSGEFQASQ